MPSASSKSENKASLEAFDPIKQAISVVEKKVRNLEKRKGKLDGYKDKRDGGEKLNQDQEEAVAKYELVLQNLDFARDLQKQFISINAEAEKYQRKQQKREKLERQAQDVQRTRRLLHLQGLLDSMGDDQAQKDFRAGKNGALLLSEENLTQLDELYKLISPSRDGESELSYEDQLTAAAEHISCYLDGREKEVLGTTYKELQALCTRIDDSHYFDNLPSEDAEEESPAAADQAVYESSALETVAEVKPDTEHIPASFQAPVEFHASERLDLHETPAQVVEHQQFSEDPYYHPTTAETAESLRPFSEIMSSMQGNFNFLQESEIESESQHRDPAIVGSHPHPPSQHPDAMLGQPGFSNPSHQDNGVLSSQQHDAGHSNAFVDQQTSLDYTSTDFTQSYLSQSLPNSSLTDVPSTYAHVMGGESLVQGADIPPAIPLPSQNLAQASMSGQDLGDDYMQSDGQSQEKKPFSMNVSAPVFQSMYSQQGGSPSFAQQVGAGIDSGSQDQGFQDDFQSGSAYGGVYTRGGSRGPRGGRSGGSRGGFNSSYNSRGGGGSRGPAFNNSSRGGGGSYNASSRGSSRGGSYQGYPPRDNYRPDGFQGISNDGFKREGAGSRGGAPRGGMRGGGPPRGNNTRGRFPAGNRYGNNFNGSTVQQAAA